MVIDQPWDRREIQPRPGEPWARQLKIGLLRLEEISSFLFVETGIEIQARRSGAVESVYLMGTSISRFIFTIPIFRNSYS